jgi:hypothetical protein
VAQVVDHLLRKREALNSNPSTGKKKKKERKEKEMVVSQANV